MSLIPCPECGNKISDNVAICPQCGYSSRGGTGSFYGFEYISKHKLFGLPLVHIVSGPAFDPTTGKLRIAKGIIAIGGIAVGWLAIGGLAVGLIAFGGLGLGLLAAIGGAAIGTGFSMGGLAVGTIAVGGCAVGYYAIGGGTFGIHALGGNAQDPGLQDLFRGF
ncbi:MAG: zinc ribbon domain-containing protein [Planctomycetales bacterium]|nr:zinc ribbon domain-containing protein [Planctomycetales bacterium]